MGDAPGLHCCEDGPLSGSRRRWLAVAGAFTAMAHGPGLHYCYGIIQAELVASRAFSSSSRAVLGGAGSLSTGVMLGGAYSSGWLQDRVGTPRTVALGAMIAAVGLGLSAATTQVWQLYATFGIIVGVGHAFSFPPCPVAVAHHFDGKPHAGLASGVATSGSGGGTMLFAVVTRLVIAAVSWRGAFTVLAASTVIFVVPSALALGGRDAKLQGPRSLSRPTGALARFVAAATLYGLGWETPFVHLVSYAVDQGMARTAAATTIVVLGAGGMCGRILVLFLADRFGPGRMLVSMCFLTMVADFLLPAVVDILPGLYAYSFVIGSTAGGCIGLTTPLAKAALREQPTGGQTLAQASGLVYSSMAPGIVAGPIVAGAIRDVTGSYDYAFLFAAACWCAALCVAWPLRRFTQQSLPSQHREGERCQSQDDDAEIPPNPSPPPKQGNCDVQLVFLEEEKEAPPANRRIAPAAE